MRTGQKASLQLSITGCYIAHIKTTSLNNPTTSHSHVRTTTARLQDPNIHKNSREHSVFQMCINAFRRTECIYILPHSLQIRPRQNETLGLLAVYVLLLLLERKKQWSSLWKDLISVMCVKSQTESTPFGVCATFI